MAAVTFTNPATGEVFVWPTNPDYNAESQGGSQYQSKTRSIERTSNTGNVGATRQQGDDGPFIIHWQFTVLYAAHEAALWKWYQTCDTQSIYLTDFAGQVYEGQIITVERARQGVVAGPGDTTAQGYYGTFVFEFEVWAFIDSVAASARAQDAPSLPLHVVLDDNDTFLLHADGTLLFTIAPGTYHGLDEVIDAVGRATLLTSGEDGEVDGAFFSTFVTVESVGDEPYLTFTAVAPGPAGNAFAITEGDGGAAAIGVTAPLHFTGGSTSPLAGVNT